MNRDEFHKLFKFPGPVVLPVIHVLDSARTRKNVEILLEKGAQGCFLINHDFPPEQFLPIIRDTRAAFPSLWMAVNFLAVTGKICLSDTRATSIRGLSGRCLLG